MRHPKLGAGRSARAVASARLTIPMPGNDAALTRSPWPSDAARHSHVDIPGLSLPVPRQRTPRQARTDRPIRVPSHLASTDSPSPISPVRVRSSPHRQPPSSPAAPCQTPSCRARTDAPQPTFPPRPKTDQPRPPTTCLAGSALHRRPMPAHTSAAHSVPAPTGQPAPRRHSPCLPRTTRTDLPDPPFPAPTPPSPTFRGLPGSAQPASIARLWLHGRCSADVHDGGGHHDH